jgi:acarbose 7IV-phosphotransferase
MRVLVAGTANVQVTVPVDGFPVEYEPVRYLPGRIAIAVGGVGFNQARHLAALGNRVSFAGPIGADSLGFVVAAEFDRLSINTSLAPIALPANPRSVILVAPDGQRAVHTDLGAALDFRFDDSSVSRAVATAEVVVVGNLDFSRALLGPASAAGRPVAVDLQVVRRLNDAYHRDFLAADLISASSEGHESPREFLAELRIRSRSDLVVVTLGADGCLGATSDGEVHHVRPPRKLTADTTGAGDCFFASLVQHRLCEKLPALDALRLATGAVSRFLGG